MGIGDARYGPLGGAGWFSRKSDPSPLGDLPSVRLVSMSST